MPLQVWRVATACQAKGQVSLYCFWVQLLGAAVGCSCWVQLLGPSSTSFGYLREKSAILGVFTKIAKKDYHPRHICLSVRPSAWNNSSSNGMVLVVFPIWLFLENRMQNIHFPLKSDNNYFTCRPIYVFYHISPVYSQNEKCFRQKL